jgi:acetyl-CoA decarbonylase/synthase complex subunit epsilon
MKDANILNRQIEKAENPLLIVGSAALEQAHGEGNMVDYFIKLSKARNIPIVATAHVIKGFLEKGFENVASMSAMELAFYLQDADWKGPHGKGPCDLVLIYGIPYYMQWCMLSSLMNFRDDLNTVTVGRYYQPHAKWSFPNLKEKNWHEHLETLLTLGGEK